MIGIKGGDIRNLGSDALIVDRISTEPCLVPGTRARPLGDSQSKPGWDSGTLMKSAAYSTASLSRYLPACPLIKARYLRPPELTTRA